MSEKILRREAGIGIILLTVFGAVLGYAYGGTISPNLITFDYINATSAYYLGATNITPRLQGDWGSTDIATTGEVNATRIYTDEFWIQGLNRTQFLIDASGGGGSGRTPCSYIIFKSGSTYYAQNGETGGIDYYGSNAGTVINSAIDAAGGGDIYLKAGTYTLTASTPIMIDQDGTTLRGAGYDTVIQSPSGFSGSLVQVTATGATIRDLQIDGSGQTSGHGLFIEATQGHFENLRVRDCAEDGIHIGHPTWISVLGGKLKHCTVKNNGGNGVYVDYDATDWEIYDILIADHSTTGKAGMVIDGSALMVSLCHFWGNYYNVLIAPAHIVNRVRLVQNGFMDNIAHGIYKNSAYSWRDSLVTGNSFWVNGYSTPYNHSDSIYIGGTGMVRSVVFVGNEFLGYKEDVGVQVTRYAINDPGNKMSYCTIVGNTISRYFMADPINVAGTTNEEAHNTVYSG